MKGKLDWLHIATRAVLIVEFGAEDEDELVDKLARFEKKMRNNHISERILQTTDSSLIKDIWRFRKLGLSFLMAQRSNARALPFLEDMAVPRASIGPFIEAFSTCIRKYGKESGIFGHVAAGCVHTRPLLDLRNVNDRGSLIEMMEELSTIVIEFGGSVSGEHGDGIVRSWLLEKMFGSSVYRVFGEFKSIFGSKINIVFVCMIL